GTPQGGIISPLLANVVLNELDWWIASQWETMPTRHEYAVTIAPNGTESRGKTYRALQSTQLKECWIVRYADDFKIFCRKRSDAVKLLAATQLWLKERLGLDISPEKSGVVNLKKHDTEFLGIKMRVRKKGKRADGTPGYTVYSGMTGKAYQAMKTKVQQHTKAIAHPADTNAGSRAVDAYNAYVLGVHNYYKIATNVSLDMRKIAFLVKHELNARLRRYVQKSGDKLPAYIAERYGHSKMLRYVYGRALIPIGYLKHQNPMFKPKKINRYTPEGRAEIHRNLSCVDTTVLRQLMRSPVTGRSIEYNDNRLSLYCGQMGRCYVTKLPLELGHMHCHHRIPKQLGGDDSYGNLVLVTDEVHRLLHATQDDTIAAYMLNLKPDSKQLRTLNRLRRWVQLPEFQPCQFYLQRL
ncbi:MAG: reverse transcriptase domain-containing protein, partial [Oscillospiraceae bacterium]